MQIEAEDFFRLQKRMPFIQSTQSQSWYLYWQEKKFKTIFFCDDIAKPKICCWGLLIKLPFLGYVLRIEGESYLESLSENDFKLFYSNIGIKRLAGILIISNSNYNLNYEIGIRRAGYKRPLGMATCPLSIKIDLTKEIEYSRNWSREKNKAILEGVYFRQIENPTTVELRSFVEMHKDMAKRKKLSHKLSEKELSAIFDEDHNFRLFFVFDKNDKPIAGRIIYTHKFYAYDMLAANSNSALENGGTFFLVQSILEYLQNSDFEFFDFGRIPPSNHSTDGVYQFKKKVRGDIIVYNGDWSWFRNKWIEYLYYIYFFEIKKNVRY